MTKRHKNKGKVNEKACSTKLVPKLIATESSTVSAKQLPPALHTYVEGPYQLALYYDSELLNTLLMLTGEIFKFINHRHY